MYTVSPLAGLMPSIYLTPQVSSGGCPPGQSNASFRSSLIRRHRSFDLQGSQRQHGRLVRLSMFDHGVAFLRTGPEICRTCHYCCSPNWTSCPRHRSRNNDLCRVAEDIPRSHQHISESSRRQKGCLLA